MGGFEGQNAGGGGGAQSFSLTPYHQIVGQHYIQKKQDMIKSNSKKTLKVKPKKIMIQNKDSLSKFIKDFEETYASGANA